VQLRYERARASELIHLLRLVLLVTALWLNNGTADSCVPSIMSLSLSECSWMSLCSVFYVAYRIYVEDRYNSTVNAIVEQVQQAL
jgi:hypothetical protein